VQATGAKLETRPSLLGGLISQRDRVDDTLRSATGRLVLSHLALTEHDLLRSYQRIGLGLPPKNETGVAIPG
jgi:hypothetical protein